MSLLDLVPGRLVIQLLYFLPVPGFTLRLASIIHRQYPVTTDNDCIFIQAFGRNTWTDEQLLGALKDNQAQRATNPMMVLRRDGFDPGQSNRDLARTAWALFLNRPVNIFAQWEVAYAMWAENPTVFDKLLGDTGLMHVLWPRGSYYPTWMVKQDSIELADELNLSHPIELAHPDMVVRATAILWRLGVRPSLRVVPIAYDFKSVQPWTRSIRQWWLRNLLGHIHHILHRWVWLIPPRPPRSSV